MKPDIVIPHYNRWDLLGKCLKSIPMDFRVFVVRGGTFSENCNLGFKLTKSKYVIFLNDDVIVNKEGLQQMIERKTDIVGSPFIYPDGKFQMYGVQMLWDGSQLKNIYTKDKSKRDYPSGSFFKIERSVFKKLGQFDEVYKNGAEDRELFIKAIENTCSISYVSIPSIHYLSASLGRTSKISQNNRIFNNRFKEARVKKIYKILDKNLLTFKR